ncbi:MAG: carotenoid biosynthesis protein [Candidatus Uhrbacteria bacterium]
MKISIISIIFSASTLVGAFILVFNPDLLMQQNIFLMAIVLTILLILGFMRQNIGLIKTLYILLVSIFVGYCVEYLGVHQGLTFSSYNYTGFLGPHLGNVPILIPLAWFGATTTAWLAARLVVGFGKRVSKLYLLLVASLFAVVYDLPIEYMAKHVWNAWEWAGSGPILGVPTLNYVGWFVVAFLIFGLSAGAWRSINKTGHGYRDLQIICFSSFGIILFHLTLSLFS